MEGESHTDRLLLHTVQEVLEAHQTRDALATATLADLNSYTKRFGRLTAPGSSEVELSTLLHHFDSELLTGEALRRILEHVGVARSARVSRGQFLAVAHLVCTALQRVQEALFEEGCVSPPATGGASSKSREGSPATGFIQRRRTVSGAGSWSIRAERPGTMRRAHHPTVAQLLQEAAVAGGSAAPSRTVSQGSSGGWQGFSSPSGEVSSASLDWDCATPTSRPQAAAGDKRDLWSSVVQRPGAPMPPGGQPHESASRGEGQGEAVGRGADVHVSPQGTVWTAFQQTSPAKVLAKRIGDAGPPAPLAVPRPGGAGALECMSLEDRVRCEKLYDRKGYHARGGMGRESGWRLFQRSGISAQDFYRAWTLAAGSKAGTLARQEFCLLVHLLHSIQQGAELPSTLSAAEGHRLLGLVLTPGGGNASLRLDTERLRSALHAHCAASQLSSRQTSPGGADTSRTESYSFALNSARSSPAPGAVAFLQSRHDKLEVGLLVASIVYRKDLDRPFLTMSVRDGAGRLVEMPQDSCPGRYSRLADSVVFKQSLTVATPLSKLPPGSSIFFELRHWKGREHRFSTLGWAAAPLDRLVRGGQVRLPLYKKPLDVSLQRVKRLGGSANLQIVLCGCQDEKGGTGQDGSQ